MEEKFERVMDADGKPIPWLYVRQYGRVRRHYAVFTDWQRIRRRIALGKNLTLQRAIKKLGDVEKKNTNEFDFDEAKTRGMTISKWADECKSALNERDAISLVHLKAVFGAKPLAKITDKELKDYRARRLNDPIIRRGKKTDKKVSPTTVNKELGLLRKLMYLALPKGIIKAMPTFTMDHEPSRKRTLTDGEYAALKDKCPDWLRRVCVGAYETCLTRSDLLNLRWDEIEYDEGSSVNVIKLKDGRDKTKVRQVVPIVTPELKALFVELEAEFKRLPNTDNLVFTRDGQKIKPMQLRRALQKACKEAVIRDRDGKEVAVGIRNFTLHDFRHCAITRWHKMKVPTATAMAMAGHSSVGSHQKYINMNASEIVDVFTDCVQENSKPTRNAASA
jgi:integrase